MQPGNAMAKKLKNIPAKAHPAHYMMHKYWGRKSHNVISEYIKNDELVDINTIDYELRER